MMVPGHKWKVLQVTHDLNIGGLQRVVVDIARNLDPERFTVEVCALREGGPFARELEADGIPVHLLPVPDDGVDYLSFWKLYQLIRRSPPQVIHTHNTQPMMDGTFAALMARVPVRVHTDHARSFPDKKRYMQAERVCSFFFDEVVGVSENTRDNLIRYEKMNPDKVSVVLNGIDGARYRLPVDRQAKKEELGLGEDRFPVLGLGVRLAEQKGIAYLLEAMPDILHRFPRAALLICGEGPLLEPLKKQADQLGLGGAVSFLGPRLDLGEVLQIFDLYVLPSLWEGLPLVLLEAMAAGLPIVATDVGGSSQVVTDMENGRLIEARNPGALSGAVLSVVEDRALMETMGRCSREKFDRQFSVSVMVDRYESLYRKWLDRKVGAV